MGSQAPLEDDDSRSINVLVTGFGPFRDTPLNPSFLIASALPPIITTSHGIVNIHAHPAPVHVSYATVRELIPALLFPPISKPDSAAVPNSNSFKSIPQRSSPNFDFVLFIGVAPGRSDFALETQARRDGYVKEDVDGKTLEGDTLWTSSGIRDGSAAPDVLGTGVDVGEVWRRWKSGLPTEPLRPSTDAGHYLCEFIYYTGLVEYWRRNPRGDRPVAFLHVPKGVDADDVTRGKRVAVGLIRALVEAGVDGMQARELRTENVDGDNAHWAG